MIQWWINSSSKRRVSVDIAARGSTLTKGTIHCVDGIWMDKSSRVYLQLLWIQLIVIRLYD